MTYNQICNNITSESRGHPGVYKECWISPMWINALNEQMIVEWRSNRTTALWDTCLDTSWNNVGFVES